MKRGPYKKPDRMKFFMSKVEFVGDCWIWKGTIKKNNGRPIFWDGVISVSSAKWIYLLRHPEHARKRLYYTTKCGNKLCVNPNHIIKGADWKDEPPKLCESHRRKRRITEEEKKLLKVLPPKQVHKVKECLGNKDWVLTEVRETGDNRVRMAVLRATVDMGEGSEKMYAYKLIAPNGEMREVS